MVSRAEQRLETRRRILEAVIEIVHEAGVEALTTVEVAKRARIKQPALYAHFKNLDDALSVAAVDVCNRVRVFYGAFQGSMIYARVELRVIAEGLTRLLEVAATQRPFIELFLRHRLDLNPLGDELRKVMEDAHRDLTTNLLELATSTGIRAKYIAEIERMADLVILAVVGALEILVRRRNVDIPDLAIELARQIAAVTRPRLDDLRERSCAPRFPPFDWSV